MLSEEHGDEGAPLIPKFDPRKKRKEIIDKLTVSLSTLPGGFPADVSLADIEQYLSVSDIKRLMRLEHEVDASYRRLKPIPAFVYFLPGLDAVSEDGSYVYKKALTAFAEDAQRHYAKNSEDFEKYVKNNVLFFVFDKTLASIKWYSWYKRRRFCSPKNGITTLALDKIEPYLRSRDLVGKNIALTRLEKLPQELIVRVLEANESYKNLNANELKNFPNILLEWSKCRTVLYQKTLNSKNLGKFTGLVSVTNDIEILKDLIRQLVHKINRSFFKGTYEDMMEECLVKLMKLSNPKEGLKLDPELLKHCLRIINNYKLSKNRGKFLNDNQDENGYKMLAYVRRTVPKLDDYPNLQDFTPDASLQTAFVWWTRSKTFSFGLSGLASNLAGGLSESRFLTEVKSGRFASPQNMLLEIAKKPNEFHTYTAFAKDLVETYGADLDFTDRVRKSFFEAALIRLSGNSEMWKFYLDRKQNHEEVLSKVIDIFVENLTRGDLAVPNACIRIAISQLITRFNPVKVTDEMMGKVRSNYDADNADEEEAEIFNLLSRKLVEQSGAWRPSSSNNNNNNNGPVFDPFAAVPAPSAATSVRRDMEAVPQPVPVKVSASAAVASSSVVPQQEDAAVVSPAVKEVAALQERIAELVKQIDSSIFKSKYEGEMEACLVKLMKLSNPKEGLKLDPELLKHCLKIINNYKRKNMDKFLSENKDAQGNTIFAYIRCTVLKLDAYPNLQLYLQSFSEELCTDPLHYVMEYCYSAFVGDLGMDGCIKDGHISPQDVLLEIAKKPDDFAKHEKLVEILVTKYGADLDFSEGKGKRSSFFEAALSELGREAAIWGIRNKGKQHDAMLNFYRESKKLDINQLLSKVIDVFSEDRCTNLVRHASSQVIVYLVSSVDAATLHVTQAMVDRVSGVENEYYIGKDKALEALRGKLAAQNLANNNNNSTPNPSAATGADYSDVSKPLKHLQEILDKPEDEDFHTITKVNALVFQAGSAVKHLTPVQVRELSRKYALNDSQFDILNEHIPYYSVFRRLAGYTYGFADILLSVLKDYYKEGEEGDKNKKAAEALIQVSTKAEKEAFLKLIEESIKGKDKASEIIAAINSNNAEPEVIKKLVEYLHDKLRSSEQAVAVQAIAAIDAQRIRRASFGSLPEAKKAEGSEIRKSQSSGNLGKKP